MFKNNITSFFLFILLILSSCNNALGSSAALTDKRLSKEWQSKKGDLLVIGQAMYDIIYKFEDKKQYKQYIKSIGIKEGSNNIVSGEIITKVMNDLTSAREQPGGSASNTAAGVASFGMQVVLKTILAEDKIGQSYLNGMDQYKVDLLVHKIYNEENNNSEAKSGIVIVIVSPEGERTMLVHPGISKHISEEFINKSPIDNYKIVLTEGYLWTDISGNNALIRKFYQSAREKGSITAFTFGDYSIVNKYRREWLELIKEIDIVFSDEQQIYALFETKNWEDIVNILKNYNAIFVVTFGEEGAYIVHQDKVMYVPIYEVPVVDTTGAGDQFAAGFLYSYLQNQPLEVCGKVGAATAAVIIQQIGGKPNIPFLQSLQTRFAELKVTQ